MIPRKRIVLIATTVAAVVAAGLWFALIRHRDAPRVLTASGTVEATEAQLGFQATGRIDKVAVREGDPVKAGMELAALDGSETEERERQAAAQVAAARALLLELERGFRPEEVAQARAAADAAGRRLEDAQRDLDRTKRLFAGGAVSQEAYDRAVLALDVAKSQDAQARDQLRLFEEGPRPERTEAQRAQLAQAQAALRAVQAAIANMTIRAPFDGVVTVRHNEPGETVPPGSPVLTVMNPDDRWVRIYVPENRIGAVKLGQAAGINSDTYPGKTYPGTVTFIAREAEFTPKTLQTAEERVKLVYAVKVRITGDGGFELKPGMPADVRLELGLP